MPANMKPKMAAIIAKVFAAFSAFGVLKNGTEFEIASTPVREAEPLVNARSRRTKLTPEIDFPIGAVAW